MASRPQATSCTRSNGVILCSGLRMFSLSSFVRTSRNWVENRLGALGLPAWRWRRW